MDVDLSDLSRWARGDGLEIVMLVTGSVLLSRLIAWVGRRVTSAIDRSDDSLVATEMTKHRHALVEVATWVLIVVVYFATAVLVLIRFNVPLSTLALPGTALGVALGLGAQRIVADLLAGFFLIAERQFGYGDEIRIAAPGSTAGVEGMVEEITLRVTRLRTLGGELLMVPNGEIRQVTNLSRDWSRAVVDVPVPIGTDIDHVNETLARVEEAAYEDEELRALLLDPPTTMGVQNIDPEYLTIRVTARTLPGKQFVVGRALRARIAVALLGDGIDVTIPPPAPDQGTAP
jgi:small conductance mechanosensitive channel